MEQKLKEITKIIAIFKEAYANFDFKMIEKGKPTAKLMVWYQVLEPIESEVLKKVALDYCRTNVFPPSSPANIIEQYKKIYKSMLQDTNEIFDYCLFIWRKNWFAFEDTIKEIEKENKKASEAFKKVRHKLYKNDTTETSENINTWARKEFIETYNEIIEQDFKKEMLKGNKLIKYDKKTNTILLDKGE